MEELLKDLKITKKGTQGDNGSYVIDIDTYDEYGKFYSLLEKAQEDGKLEQLADKSIITVHTTDVSYVTDNEEGDTFELSLLGDLDQDIYKLVINKF